MNRRFHRTPDERLSRGHRYASAAVRAVLAPNPNPTVYEEMLTGSLVGLLASVLFAWVAGAAAAVILAMAMLGFCAGAVIGLVLWSGSADLPEDPVLPPHPSQRRDRRPPPG